MMNPAGVSLLRLNQQGPLATLQKSEKFIQCQSLSEKQEQTAPANAKSTTEGAAEGSEDLSGTWENAMKTFEDQVFMSQIPLCVPSI
ncbi:hypothetical protein TCE0_060r18664 [Talaromyces pinophilus]|uniref:Uncharacterized protein n=1 Tax=Talaromyces pinophilus TaxID=128442 RepID=A0A6V8HNX5_TALPI|nr:hypothetical protein TCE0_060r18664 [Talaromyces pinophilus]